IGLPEINHPYRGWKLTFFEGGIRVPLFVRWPARIDAGSVVDTPAAHIDLFPTIVEAAGGRVPDDRVIDGIDLMEFLEPSVERPLRRAIFWRNGDYRAVLSGDWKLQVAERPSRIW